MSATNTQHRASHLPPLLYFAVGIACLVGWYFGTLVQVQTSEQWFASALLHGAQVPGTVMEQIGQILHGTLPDNEIAPVWFAIGVQLALIAASAGLEMPKYPVWRHRAAWGVIILLVGVNSAGDWFYSSVYGFWGALGFTTVVLFITFVLGLLATMSITHGFKVMFASGGD